jgi:phospholipid/cholesterol/gamma-HCH transport system ATP-binding protein
MIADADRDGSSIELIEPIVKLRDLEHVTSIVVTHQMRDAFYVASHEAARSADGAQARTSAQTSATPVSFMVLHEGRIWFEGSAAELRESTDVYLRHFLFKTLPPW